MGDWFSFLYYYKKDKIFYRSGAKNFIAFLTIHSEKVSFDLFLSILSETERVLINSSCATVTDGVRYIQMAFSKWCTRLL